MARRWDAMVEWRPGRLIIHSFERCGTPAALTSTALCNDEDRHESVDW